jgi:hypothetical protein
MRDDLLTGDWVWEPLCPAQRIWRLLHPVPELRPYVGTVDAVRIDRPDPTKGTAWLIRPSPEQRRVQRLLHDHQELVQERQKLIGIAVTAHAALQAQEGLRTVNATDEVLAAGHRKDDVIIDVAGPLARKHLTYTSWRLAGETLERINELLTQRDLKPFKTQRGLSSRIERLLEQLRSPTAPPKD